MTKVIKSNFVPSKYKLMSGKNVSNGQLRIMVDKMPEFVYRQIGDYFYAETDGFVSVYLHNPRDNQGFGGAEISLKMIDGSVRTFKGTLWHPLKISADVPDYKSGAITTDSVTAG